MSISSTSYLDQRLNMMLAQLTNASSTNAVSMDGDDNADGSSVSGDTAVPTVSPDNSLTGPSKAPISDDILALLTQMQQMSGASGALGSQPTTSSTNIATASAAISPLSQLVSAIGTNGDGTISQSEMETYIQNLGGTTAQADTLYADLNQGNSGNITQTQLASDLSQAQTGNNTQDTQHAEGHHHHHHHGAPSANSVADDLMQAIDGSNNESSSSGSSSSSSGSINESQFSNFVTSLGGTTSEASSDFAALDPNDTGSVNAAQISTAIKAFEALGNSATIAINSASPILTFLDSLQANNTAPAASTSNVTATINVTA